MTDILEQVEELLEKVSVQGEENWRRMAAAKEILRKLEEHIQKAAAEQKKKEAEKDADAKDGVCG